jgi:D-glycero-D-manno-heptose 1,7-bisphosphate phosphatase
MPHPAVFLDRDNTIIDDPGYLADPQGVRLLAGAAEALKRLADAAWRLVVVTNQSGIARGLLTEERLHQVHAEMQRQLALRGATLDAIYYCPYLPDAAVQAYARDSDERKPNPGMLLRAAREMDLDLSASWMIGDGDRDIEAGRRAGCRTIRVRRAGVGVEEELAQADFTVTSLAEAAQIILREAAPPAATSNTQAAVARPASPKMTDNELLQELLQIARQLVRLREGREFSVTKLIAGIAQGLALLAFVLGAIKFIGLNSPATSSDAFWQSMGYLAIAGFCQLAALTFFLMNDRLGS